MNNLIKVLMITAAILTASNISNAEDIAANIVIDATADISNTANIDNIEDADKNNSANDSYGDYYIDNNYGGHGHDHSH